MSESELWKEVMKFFVANFQTEENVPIETILFLIGLQELGSGKQKYKKDDKVSVKKYLQMAVCGIFLLSTTVEYFRIVLK